MSLQIQLNAISQKLKEVEKMEEHLRITKAAMRSEKVDLLRVMYPKIWVVRTHPVDQYHVEHDRAWYTLESDARLHAMGRRYSDGIEWYQTVHQKDSLDIRSHILLDRLITEKIEKSEKINEKE